ncbi:MAG: twin-arginine translocase TatA/TatE family subunit [Chloroflexota bacterium]
MDILGIGIQEILFIMVLALIILGPKDIVKTGRKVGAWLRQFVLSEEWRVMRQTGEELRDLPSKLMREANPDLDMPMEEVNKKVFGDDYGTWSRQKPIPTEGLPPDPGNTIAPPQPAPEAEAGQKSTADPNEETHENPA